MEGEVMDKEATERFFRKLLTILLSVIVAIIAVIIAAAIIAVGYKGIMLILGL